MKSNIVRKSIMALAGFMGALVGMANKAEAYSAWCGWTCFRPATNTWVNVSVACPGQYATASCWSTGPSIINPTNLAYQMGLVYQTFGCYTNTTKVTAAFRGMELTNCSNDRS